MCSFGALPIRHRQLPMDLVSLFVNLWGGLDALLRFPAAHEIKSFFATKQFALLVTKSLSYAFGICDFRCNSE